MAGDGTTEEMGFMGDHRQRGARHLVLVGLLGFLLAWGLGQTVQAEYGDSYNFV